MEQLSGLQIDALACARGGRPVFAGLSVHVPRGQALLLKGPNGSGKSSLLRTLAGLTSRAAGEFTYDGQIADGQLVYIGHAEALKPVQTLAENASAWARVMTGRAPSREQLTKAAEQLDLVPLLDREVRYFSAGQKHRSSLMRLALADRPLWLLDEPTVGLDRAARILLDQMMQRHLEKGGTIVAATHEQMGVEALEIDLSHFAPVMVDVGDDDVNNESWDEGSW